MPYPIIHMMEQGSPEWYAIRSGHVTSSVFHTAIGTGQSRTDLMKDLRDDLTRIVPGSIDRICTNAMKRGTATEPEAREEYIRLNGPIVKEVGFVELNEYIGASTDGLVGEDGMIEIKCPNTRTHNDWVEGDKLPTTHRFQVHGGLWVTGRKWCDFISYDPRLKEPYWSVRVERDESIIAELQVKIGKFVDELKTRINKLAGPKF